MRVVGVAGSMFLVGALALVGLGLFGGPNTPFSVFDPPRTHVDGKGAGGQASRPGQNAPGNPATSPTGASASHRSSHRRSSASRSASPRSPSASQPTNRAGKTPRGHSHTPTPPPHPSPSSTHGR